MFLWPLWTVILAMAHTWRKMFIDVRQKVLQTMSWKKQQPKLTRTFVAGARAKQSEHIWAVTCVVMCACPDLSGSGEVRWDFIDNVFLPSPPFEILSRGTLPDSTDSYGPLFICGHCVWCHDFIEWLHFCKHVRGATAHVKSTKSMWGTLPWFCADINNVLLGPGTKVKWDVSSVKKL